MTCQQTCTYVAFSFDFHFWFAHNIQFVQNTGRIQVISKYFIIIMKLFTYCNISVIAQLAIAFAVSPVASAVSEQKAKRKTHVHTYFSDQILKQILSHPIASNTKHLTNNNPFLPTNLQ